MNSTAMPTSGITPLRTAFFAAVVGVFIFNVFASQVVVANIAAGLGLEPTQASLIPSLTALGYALGLLFIVPLADVVENRRLVISMAVTCAGALLLAGLTHQPILFLALCFTSGAAASLIQILVPLVGSLTPAATRGRVLGNVMSGLMLGIMVSRPFASLVGERFGWRAVYLTGAFLIAAIILPLRAALPERKPAASVGYGAALASLGTLLRREPILRSNAITAALVMGAFNVFWTAIADRLTSSPFHLSARGIALFGLVGTTGAVSAPVMGWLGDRGWTRIASLAADVAVIGALLLALLAGGALGTASPVLGVAGLAAAAVLLDLGVIGDQTLGRRAINMLEASAIGRRNGLFVGIFFLGGAAGSAVVGPALALGGWPGVSLAGAAFGLAALLVSASVARTADSASEQRGEVAVRYAEDPKH
jgi:predicted MFS family arabinose efflux permease